MRPLVGITAVPRERIEAVATMPHATLNEGLAALCDEAGGIPVILTATTDVAGLAARIDALVAKVREAIERLKELRTALISAAVTGKIDVREEVAA